MAIRSYPTLYRCRTDVLRQWFCVPGNGMGWRDGKLVDAEPDEEFCSEEEQISWATDFMRIHLERAQEHGDPQRIAECRIRLQMKEDQIRFRMRNADDLALVSWNHITPQDPFVPQAIYPLCEYSRLNSVPDDVVPDYLAAVREMIFEIFASKPNQPGLSHLSAEENRQVHADNLKFADQVLQSLHVRFGSSGIPTSLAEFQDRRKNCLMEINKMLDATQCGVTLGT